MNPKHTFITHLFTIPCTHLIILLCWNILNSHLIPEILQRHVLRVACTGTLNRILSMHTSQICSLLLFPTEFFMLFLPLSLLHKQHWLKTRNYEIFNSTHLSITSSLLEFNFLFTLLLNSLNIHFFLNMRNQVSDTKFQTQITCKTVYYITLIITISYW